MIDDFAYVARRRVFFERMNTVLDLQLDEYGYYVDFLTQARYEAFREAYDRFVPALERARELHEKALPKFNWGASALDANAIKLLNEVPGEVHLALTI